MAARVWEADELRRQRGSFFQGDWPTISESFHRTCSRYPERSSCSSYAAQEMHLSYRQLEQQVALAAGFLQSQGVGGGTRVALSGANSIAWAVLYLAVLDLAAVVVPLDAKLSPDRVAQLAHFSESQLLFVDGHYPQLQGLWPAQQLFRLNGEEGLLARAAAHQQPLAQATTCGCDQPAVILFTSGTTGDEKGVVLSHRNLVVNTYQVTHPDFFSVYPEDRFYLLLPMHHIYPMTAVFLEAIFHGSTLVFPQGLAFPLILDDLSRGAITILIGVPLFYNKILRGIWRKIKEKGAFVHTLMRLFALMSKMARPLLGRRLGKLLFSAVTRALHLQHTRVMISGGGPLAAAVVEGFNQLGLCFVEGYGLTEAAPILTLNPANRFKPGSVGRVLPLLEVRIDQPNAEGIGEVLARGENIFAGYYRNPSASQQVLDAEGWLHTGDLGYFDEDNYLYLAGRKKSVIVTSAGKNIFPEEVEHHFHLCPEIAFLVVRGYRDAKHDQLIEALIYPEEEFRQGASEQQVDHCLRQRVREVNRKLRSYERISRLWVLTLAPPLSGTAKIRRYLIPAEPTGARLVEI